MPSKCRQRPDITMLAQTIQTVYIRGTDWNFLNNYNVSNSVNPDLMMSHIKMSLCYAGAGYKKEIIILKAKKNPYIGE